MALQASDPDAASYAPGDAAALWDPERQGDFAPWQTVAVVPARAALGRGGAPFRCACALPFLLEGCEYDVAVDWRWRRLGDASWTAAYEAVRFEAPRATPPPPPPRPLPVPPEVWDGEEQLQALAGEPFALLAWPFARPPASEMGGLAPPGTLLRRDARDPLQLGDHVVQCQAIGGGGAAGGEGAPWIACRSRLLVVRGKPLCLVLGPPPPPQSPLAGAPGGATGQLELRVVRRGDGEASPVLACAFAPPVAPFDVECHLKLLPPRSALVVAVRFRASAAPGGACAPRHCQLRVRPLEDQRPQFISNHGHRFKPYYIVSF